MGFPFQGGCLYPLRDFFNKPDKGGWEVAPLTKTFSKNPYSLIFSMTLSVCAPGVGIHMDFWPSPPPTMRMRASAG